MVLRSYWWSWRHLQPGFSLQKPVVRRTFQGSKQPLGPTMTPIKRNKFILLYASLTGTPGSEIWSIQVPQNPPIPANTPSQIACLAKTYQQQSFRDARSAATTKSIFSLSICFLHCTLACARYQAELNVPYHTPWYRNARSRPLLHVKNNLICNKIKIKVKQINYIV